jgi:hypothetical protein
MSKLAQKSFIGSLLGLGCLVSLLGYLRPEFGANPGANVISHLQLYFTVVTYNLQAEQNELHAATGFMLHASLFLLQQ